MYVWFGWWKSRMMQNKYNFPLFNWEEKWDYEKFSLYEFTKEGLKEDKMVSECW